MLKNKLWIVALFAALTMAFFGCTNLSEGLDDGSGPVPAEDLVLEGSKIVLASAGSTSSTISGTKVTIPGGTSTGFYIELPAEGVDKYPNVIVYMKVDNVVKGKPGLLMKSTSQLNANVGGVGNDDPFYQLNDIGGAGTEFNTGLQRANQFTANRFAFQHQAWQPPPGNADAEYTIEVLKVVFPGSGGAADTGYPPRTYAIPDTGAGPTATGNVFYVNLNDKRDGVGISSSGTPADPVPGVLTYKAASDPDDPPDRNDIELTFTKENQRAFFKLTAEQVALLTEADSAKVTVIATTPAGGTFTWRYGFASTTLAGGWNADGMNTTIGTEQTVTFNSSKSDKTLAYFTIQARGAGTETVLRVESIKIETVKKNFPGDLTIVPLYFNSAGVTQTTAAGSHNATLTAVYSGDELVTYTWKRGDDAYGTGMTVSASADVIAEYEVTINAYGFTPKSAKFSAYFVVVDIPIYFGATGDTADAGTLLAVPVLDGKSAGLSGGTNGEPAKLEVLSDNSGFKFTYGTIGDDAYSGGAIDYGSAYVAFPVSFPVAGTFADPTIAGGITAGYISKVTFTFIGTGDVGWKDIRLLMTNALPGDGLSGSETTQVASIYKDNAGTAASTWTFTVDRSKTSSLTGTVYIIIYGNCGSENNGRTEPTTYTISDVKLHN